MKNAVCLILFISLALGLHAQVEKRFQKNFNIKDQGSLVIKNSFGTVAVESFKGNTVEVLVVITVEVNNSKYEQEALNNISVEATEEGNTVRLTTVNNSSQGRSKTKSFSVDYTVKVPEKTNIEIRNSFGDVRLGGSISGNVDIDVQHGDCVVGRVINSESKYRIQFGDIRAEAISNAQLKISHGDATLGLVDGANIKAQFGDVRIEYLSGEVEVDISHGDLRVEEIKSSLRSFNLDAQFSDIELAGFSAGDYLLEVEGSFTDVSWKNFGKSTKREAGMNNSSYLLSTASSSQNAKTIYIDADHGSVRLR